MTNPSPVVSSAPARGFPWKTIGGAALWALGVILHAVLPQSPPALPVILQGAGAGLGSLGAVSATSDMLHALPSMKYSSQADVSAWPSVTMVTGGLYYAASRLASAVAPAHLHTALAVSGALSVLASVVGWRVWMHHTVSQSAK